METSEPSREQVVQWLEAVQHELDAVHDRLSPLLEEQRRLEARQALLKDLLSSFQVPEQTSPENGGRAWAVSVQPTGSVRDYVRARAEEILREQGGPLHINALHAEFERRGLPVPGAGRPVNLTVHLREAPGIVSPARGMYALREHADGMPTQPNGSTRTRRRNRPRRRTKK